MKPVYSIGIDFGTSNSCVCSATFVSQENGQTSTRPVRRPAPVMIQSADTVPTALFLGAEDEPPAFGELAEEKSLYPSSASEDPGERVKSHFKLDFGTPGRRGVEAFQYTRSFLQFLRTRLEDTLPLGGEEDATVRTFLGHPVQWNAEQRRLLVQAAREAGFPAVQLEDEATAAVYYHLCEQNMELPQDRATRLLVVDMGGGTTDFAFVELPASPAASPVTTPVDPHPLVRAWDESQMSYGGRDIDLLLRQRLAGRLGCDESSRHWDFLLRETRRFKEQFSCAVARGRNAYRASWVLDDKVHDVCLTRPEFEEIAGAYIDHLPRLIHAALSLEGLRPHQVDGVVLTGGGSRWYWAEAAVRRICPHLSAENGTLVKHEHPEQSVARGLSYIPGVEALGERPRPRRRSAHGIWMAAAPAAAEPVRGTAALPPGPSPQPETLIPVVDRGQILPFTATEPTTLWIERVSSDPIKAVLEIRIYTGSSAGTCSELLSQVALFERPMLERWLRRLSRFLPWSTPYDRDRFAVHLCCSLDENEFVAGDVIIRRFQGEKVVQEATQSFKLTGTAAEAPAARVAETGGKPPRPVIQSIGGAAPAGTGDSEKEGRINAPPRVMVS